MKIGLTGGIACGKTTAIRIFSQLGYSTIETDAIVHALLDRSESIQHALRERWGNAVFDADNKVNRKLVAKIVFDADAELKWLENLLHPEVRRVWTADIAKQPGVDWVVEIPLLFEKRLETEFDLTVCVISRSNLACERMLARGNSQAEITQRRNRQMPLKEKVKYADYVLSNSGSLEFLRQQIEHFIDSLSKKKNRSS